jgi:tetratricopeptide (TPR) repeat protein
MLATVYIVLTMALLGGTAGFEAHAERLAAAPDAQSALRLAQGLGARGKLAQALEWSKTAAQRGAHPLRVHLVRGDAYLHSQRWELAIREFYEVVSQAPANGYALVRLWRCFHEADVLPDILDAARLRSELRKGGLYLPEAPTRPPNRALAGKLRSAGKAAILAGRFRDAIGKLHAALAQDDKDPAAYLALGTAHERMGQPALAVGAYRLFLELADRESRATRDARRFVDGVERRRGRTGRR